MKKKDPNNEPVIDFVKEAERIVHAYANRENTQYMRPSTRVARVKRVQQTQPKMTKKIKRSLIQDIILALGCIILAAVLMWLALF